MAITCDNINQTANYLKIQFQDCKNLKAEDMQLFVDLVIAVGQCANGGANYSTLITESYDPPTDLPIQFPPNTYHSLNIMVISGSIERNINGTIVTFPEGTVLKHEVTTLNQLPYLFTVKGGSNVIVEYLIETI